MRSSCGEQNLSTESNFVLMNLVAVESSASCVTSQIKDIRPARAR